MFLESMALDGFIEGCLWERLEHSSQAPLTEEERLSLSFPGQQPSHSLLTVV